MEYYIRLIKIFNMIGFGMMGACIVLALVSLAFIFFSGSGFGLHPVMYVGIAGIIYYMLGKFNILMANHMANKFVTKVQDDIESFDKSTDKYQHILKILKQNERLLEEMVNGDEPKDRDRLSSKININIPEIDDDKESKD